MKGTLCFKKEMGGARRDPCFGLSSTGMLGSVGTCSSAVLKDVSALH